MRRDGVVIKAILHRQRQPENWVTGRSRSINCSTMHKRFDRRGGRNLRQAPGEQQPGLSTAVGHEQRILIQWMDLLSFELSGMELAEREGRIHDFDR